MAKDKTRSKVSFSKAHTRKENLAEDSEVEKQEKSLLKGCKSYLSSIFVHWEPLCSSEPQLAQPRDKRDPSPLASDTAHLLTKWSLRCLVEDSYDENRTKEFLCWVEKALIKYKETVDVVILDPGWKADLLRLHHQAFEAHCNCRISSNVETFQLFTNIMISLLETQGNLPALHHAIVSACLPESKHDQSRCGKSTHKDYTTRIYSSQTNLLLMKCEKLGYVQVNMEFILYWTGSMITFFLTLQDASLLLTIF